MDVIDIRLRLQIASSFDLRLMSSNILGGSRLDIDEVPDYHWKQGTHRQEQGWLRPEKQSNQYFKYITRDNEKSDPFVRN